MSFVDGFYSYIIDIVDTERQVYATVRLKTPKHPNETLTHLAARVLAFAHSWEAGLAFSEGLYEPKQPTVWRRDVTGAVKQWIQIGVPERKKVERALREHGGAALALYFFEPEQLREFCCEMRSSKSPWLERVRCYEIPPDVVERVAAGSRSSARWNMLFTDQLLCLTADGQEEQFYIRPLPMQEIFGRYLENNRLA